MSYKTTRRIARPPMISPQWSMAERSMNVNCAYSSRRRISKLLRLLIIVVEFEQVEQIANRVEPVARGRRLAAGLVVPARRRGPVELVVPRGKRWQSVQPFDQLQGRHVLRRLAR